MVMADITKKLLKRVRRVALMVTKECPEHKDDCIQEGLLQVWEAEDGHEEAFYSQKAYWRMLDYLRKEHLYEMRNNMLKDVINHSKLDSPMKVVGNLTKKQQQELINPTKGEE